jgi:two-component system response regulator AtoC
MGLPDYLFRDRKLMAQILIIEDELLLAKSLSRALTGRGHDCITASNAEEGLRLLDKMPTDVVLVDLQLPGMSGFDAMKRIRHHDSDIAVIVVTAYGTMASAVEAMRSGASDFLRKPLDTEELDLAVERAVANARLRHTVSYYQSREAEKMTEDELICLSPGMKHVRGILTRLTLTRLPRSSEYPPVLILGETGTGKDLLARYIHFNGKFAEEPFVEVNCSSLPRGLEEAELFGYEKGAFTGAQRSKRGLFEAAEGGTVFLNEIGDLNFEAQVKLLQVIENKSLRRVGGLRDTAIDVRIVAATNRDLKDRDKFRDDLYHRLDHLKIEIPPLRKRQEDILPLAELFLQKFSQKYGVRKKLSGEARDAIINYHWPGNVRELRHVIERAIFLSSDEILRMEDINLPLAVKEKKKASKQKEYDIDLPKDGLDLRELEKALILKALEETGGNVSKAAKILHIGREALRYRIQKYKISKSVKIVG